MTMNASPPVDPTTLKTPELLTWAEKCLRETIPGGVNGTDQEKAADELAIRAARLAELEYQAQPDRNDLTGQTPAQIMATVNAPSPQ